MNASDTTSPTDSTDSATFPDQPLYEPLPYGAGFDAPRQHYGYGVAPERMYSPPVDVATTDEKSSGSPVLAVAGLLSLAVAVWTILGAPVIGTTVVVAGGLVLVVLVGLMMVVRR